MSHHVLHIRALDRVWLPDEGEVREDAGKENGKYVVSCDVLGVKKQLDVGDKK